MTKTKKGPGKGGFREGSGAKTKEGSPQVQWRSVYTTQELLDWYKAQAEKEGVSLTDYTRNLLKAHYDAHQAKATPPSSTP